MAVGWVSNCASAVRNGAILGLSNALERLNKRLARQGHGAAYHVALFYPQGRSSGCFSSSQYSAAKGYALRQYVDPCERRDLACVRTTLLHDERARTAPFYLALENSLCFGYVSEKFWGALELGMVPIANGGLGSSFEYEFVAPPQSFIHLESFIAST